jgi:hypothetical protein
MAEETRDEMTTVRFPGLTGVLPDHGRFDPLDWGLGVQLNTSPPKSPVAPATDGRGPCHSPCAAPRRRS